MKLDQFLEQLKNTIGANTGSSLHGLIISDYNNIIPLPRGYKLREKDPWCAAYVSSMWWHCMRDRPFPYECSCTMMVEKCKEMGIWIENEKIRPEPGWLIFYDWDDSGIGDCLGGPDHVGYVWQVAGDKITTIEGNRRNAVASATINVDGKYIRGYGALIYDDDEVYLAKEFVTKNGIIKGDGTADSWKHNITREQLAVILWRYHNMK